MELQGTVPEGRALDVLQAVIELYVQMVQPVGSRTISRYLGSRWSPATIRNVMADLEEAGYLEQPHLSAGRVPTTRALRYWVERLVEPRPPEASLRRALEEVATAEVDPVARIERVTDLLSEAAQGAGLASVPTIERTRLQRAELVPVGDRRLLVLWVTRSGVVYHRTVRFDEPIDRERVALLERILNEEYRGYNFEELLTRLECDMRATKAEFDAIIQGLRQLTEPQGESVIVEGVGRILEQPEFTDLERLRRLYEAFEDRHALATLLGRIWRDGGLQVLLDEETGLTSGVGVVAAPYARGVGGGPLGSVGVVGPTRMPYPTVLGLVAYAAEVLTRSFERE